MKIKTWDTINLLRGYVDGLMLGVKLSDEIDPKQLQDALQRLLDSLNNLIENDPIDVEQPKKELELKPLKGKAKK